MEEYVALEGNKSSMFSSTDAMVNDNSAPLEQLEFALHQLYNKISKYTVVVYACGRC